MTGRCVRETSGEMFDSTLSRSTAVGILMACYILCATCSILANRFSNYQPTFVMGLPVSVRVHSTVVVYS